MIPVPLLLVRPAVCAQCPHCKVIGDRDPHDWFNDDDVAVVCSRTKNPTQNEDSKYISEQQSFRVVEGGVRPYQASKVGVPDWCPIPKSYA